MGRITMDQAQEMRKELEASASAIEQSTTHLDTGLCELAQDWAALDNFEVLGSGPSKGSAAYGAAKLIEAAGSHALYQDVEEWAHLHYFVARAAQTGTLVIAPSQSLAVSRITEVVRYLDTLQRPYRVLTDGESKPDQKSLHIPAHVREMFSPIVHAAPLALFAGYVADAQGGEYGRGSQGQWADSANAMTVKNSAIED